MRDIPNHISPTYSDEARDDALFHYTTASGLIGILNANELWSTAYYCANDESELTAGEGVLSPIFRSNTYQLIEAKDPRVRTFSQRGVDIRDYAEGFEQQVTAMAWSLMCLYMTCFCKPASKEDFTHGLLSQWRGYGTDGGYALQFSRKKLLAAMAGANDPQGAIYELKDVFYDRDNALKPKVLSHTDKFVQAYSNYLDELAEPIDFKKTTWRSPLQGLTGGPLECLLDYLVQTKNTHFREERECRLSVLQTLGDGALGVNYFNRAGIVVPYVKTPRAFDVLSCIDWIVVGPAPRMTTRFKSVNHLVRQRGLQIKVRPSHIPFTRI